MGHWRLGLTVFVLWLLGGVVSVPAQGRRWPVRLEEPTGIERRDREVVLLEVSFPPGQAHPARLRVLDPERREIPSQLAVHQQYPDGSIQSAEVLFPATLLPGQLPEYSLITILEPPRPPPGTHGGDYPTDIIIRRLGTRRLELGNRRFGLILNLGKDGTTPAVVEAYHRGAGPARMVNLVETTPDLTEPLALGVRSAGWGTALDGATRRSGFTDVQVLESGPLRARVRLAGARQGDHAETWEFEWFADSPVLVWRARVGASAGRYGYFFSAVSAAPYVPFTHWVGGAEVGWPDGWETHRPPHKTISAEAMDDLPGWHLLYYEPKENYGALQFIELDRTLHWTGIGSRQFFAAKDLARRAEVPATPGLAAIRRPDVRTAAAQWSSQIALAFPDWKGTETLLEARAVYRRFAQPILAQPLPPGPYPRAGDYQPAFRTPTYQVQSGPPAPAGAALPFVSLDGPWKLQHAEKGQGERQRFCAADFDDVAWRTAQVPGSVHTQVLKYPDYFSRAAEWISFEEWWYRRRFRVPKDWGGRRLRLQFDATDYYADVWLNGRRLGRHEGYIDPYEFDVTDAVQIDGDNVLAVRVWTPVDYYWRHRPYTIKGSYGAVDQKPDDITALGITRSVRLVAGGPLRIESLFARPVLNADGTADLDVEVTLAGEAAAGRLELTLAPRNFTGGETLTARLEWPGDAPPGTLRLRLHLERPALWWTWDHGRPNLYTLTARVLTDGRLSDGRVQAVGLRQIERVGWVFYLNGRRLFIRGTNAYYLELFMSEMTRAKYERDLRLMLDMNVNMIRLHCHFQNPEFYDLCDEMGLLVWQDFLEAWYPHDPEFARRAAALYDAHIAMVRQHPCIALWATSDEEDLENYRVLTKHLAARLFAQDPERRPVVRSTGRYGDAHVYYGWYEGSIWQYAKTDEAFISELGATALPDYESLVQFLPDHWPIERHAEAWVFRKLQVPEAMRAWGHPGGRSLREYIPHTQAYVARLHQLAIERMRRRKYDAGGILHFHAIDFWPSVTMAAVDYFRRPTKSFFTVQRSFQMVLASFEYDRAEWEKGTAFAGRLWVINDHWHALPGATVRWQVEGEKGAVLARGQQRIDIAADAAARVGEVRWMADRAGPFTLRTEVLDAEGRRVSENLYEFEVR